MSAPGAFVYPTNGPYDGGSRTPAFRPVDVSGTIGAPAPQRAPPGVAPGSILHARNTSGTNVRVPYTRVSPKQARLPTNEVGPIKDPMEGLVAGQLAWVRCGNTTNKRKRDSGGYPGHGVGVDRLMPLCTTDFASQHINDENDGSATHVAMTALDVTVTEIPDPKRRDFTALGGGGITDFKALARTIISDLGWKPDGLVITRNENGGGLKGIEDDSHYVSEHGEIFNIAVQGPAVAAPWHVPAVRGKAFNEYVKEMNTTDIKIKAVSTLQYVYVFVLATVKKIAARDHKITELKLVKLTDADLEANKNIYNKASGNEHTFKLGGWRIGKIMDTAASRSAVSTQTVRQVLGSNALLVNVAIRQVDHEGKLCA